MGRREIRQIILDIRQKIGYNRGAESKPKRGTIHEKGNRKTVHNLPCLADPCHCADSVAVAVYCRHFHVPDGTGTGR